MAVPHPSRCISGAVQVFDFLSLLKKLLRPIPEGPEEKEDDTREFCFADPTSWVVRQSRLDDGVLPIRKTDA